MFSGPPDFFRGFCRRIFSPRICGGKSARRRIFSPRFCGGKSAQKNPPGKSLAKSSKICATKIPDAFKQRG